MTKEQTIQIKGIAILMMLFLHLFMSGQVAEMCSPVLFIGSTPLVQILTRSCTPVGIFLILSGYGLSYVYAHGKLNLAKQLKRLFKLYLHYWIVLLVFVGIGCFVAPDKYPGSVLTILSNVTSWDTTYNAEIWFLFPYALLSLTAFAIFRVMDKIGNLASFILTGILYLAACAFISRYLAPRHLYHEVYSPIVTYFDLLFEFVLGAILYRMSDTRIESIKHIFVKKKWLALLLLLVCFLLHLFTGFQGLNPIYCFCVILLLLQLLPPHLSQGKYGIVPRFLHEMGDKSMVMWMTHTFFSNYLFHNFIYGFRYPLVIFFVLLLMSYIVAVIIMKLVAWIYDA